MHPGRTHRVRDLVSQKDWQPSAFNGINTLAVAEQVSVVRSLRISRPLSSAVS